MTSATCRSGWRPTNYLLEELLRYGAGIGMDLEDIDLSGQDLAGINLRGATLTDASLNGANMRGAILDRVWLCNVDARTVDLTGASLRHAVIIDTEFEPATVTGIATDGSILIRTDGCGRFRMVDGLVRCKRRPTTRTNTRSTPWP